MELEKRNSNRNKHHRRLCPKSGQQKFVQPCDQKPNMYTSKRKSKKRKKERKNSIIKQQPHKLSLLHIPFVCGHRPNARNQSERERKKERLLPTLYDTNTRISTYCEFTNWETMLKTNTWMNWIKCSNVQMLNVSFIQHNMHYGSVCTRHNTAQHSTKHKY